MKILFVVPCGVHVACGAVRVLQYLPYLEREKIDYKVVDYHHSWSIGLLNIEYALTFRSEVFKKVAVCALRFLRDCFNRAYGLYVNYKICLMASRFDAVFSQRVLLPANVIDKLLEAQSKLIFDFDDAVFIESQEKVDLMINKSCCVVTGNHYLYKYAEKLNPNTVLVPSSVPIQNYRIDKENDKPVITIGWIGSSHTLHYVSLVYDALRELTSEGYDIKLLLAGTWGSRDYISLVHGINILDVPFYKAEDIPALVGEMDIGIMPLFDTPWEKGKCAMKALLYMAGAKPVVSSPVGEVINIVEDGVNGYLAATTCEWKDKLRVLIENSQLRREIGRKGRSTVERSYSTESCFTKLKTEVFDKL